MKYQFVYLNVVTVCLNELDSVCLDGPAGQGKPSGGSLKYLFVYLHVRKFECSYRMIITIMFIMYNKHPLNHRVHYPRQRGSGESSAPSALWIQRSTRSTRSTRGKKLRRVYGWNPRLENDGLIGIWRVIHGLYMNSWYIITWRIIPRFLFWLGTIAISRVSMGKYSYNWVNSAIYDSWAEPTLRSKNPFGLRVMLIRSWRTMGSGAPGAVQFEKANPLVIRNLNHR